MQLHQLKPSVKNKTRKRVGRGGAHGTYATRGLKGQKSRSGVKIRPGFEGGRTPLKKLVPKKRGVGFRKKMPEKPVLITLSKLSSKFKKDETVNSETLLKVGLIKYLKQGFKILSNGEIKHNLTVEKCPISKSAKEKIIKLGGKVE